MLSSKIIKRYLERGLLVSNLIDINKQLQPAGIDLTVAKIFKLNGIGSIDFTNENRALPDYKEVKANGDFWLLKEGIYNVSINEYIKLPREVAAIVLPRSSSLSCGIEIHTALWDPGYNGRGFLYINVKNPVKVYKNARIAQMIFFKVDEPDEIYNGYYNGEDLLKFSKRGRDESKNSK